MTILPHKYQGKGSHPRARGSLLIIVMWIAFGLVAIALYFGNSIMFELRASDHNTAGVEAEQAIEGASKYLLYALTNAAEPGHIPNTNLYQYAAVPVGDATFWIIGRTNLDEMHDLPVFGVVDEASKINLNTASSNMLVLLPRMTPSLAAAIIDWRDTNEVASVAGAESDTYMRLNPPYKCKNAPFESIEELRLVFGFNTEILYGEDANLNGVLDPNENDGNITPPFDNRDGRLDPGILEYVTVYSREPNLSPGGTNRININATSRTNLNSLLETTFGEKRGKEIEGQLPRASTTTGTTTFSSLIDFYLRSKMTVTEFGQIADYLGVSDQAFVDGLINVNTASDVVLSCIPGIGIDYAKQVVAYRKSNPTQLSSVAWVAEMLSATNALSAGPYITTRSFQFSADIVATGHQGRGYRRSCFIYDLSSGTPTIIYRRDRARLAWALGGVQR